MASVVLVANRRPRKEVLTLEVHGASAQLVGAFPYFPASAAWTGAGSADMKR